MMRTFHALVGIGLCVFAGMFAAPGLGAPNAINYSLLLLYLFAVSTFSMIALGAVMRPPFRMWQVIMPAVFCFMPMYLGWFPVSGWMHELGRDLRWQGLPSYNWLLAVMIIGLLCPDGALLSKSLRRSIRESRTPNA